mmetsp:Transcript_5601/g.21076  ORF Transcript_5601/g.21076 Transcript_5601/m.21076 type:complete len:114 (+) Transcript_5601:1150-1491(+)
MTRNAVVAERHHQIQKVHRVVSFSRIIYKSSNSTMHLASLTECAFAQFHLELYFEEEVFALHFKLGSTHWAFGSMYTGHSQPFVNTMPVKCVIALSKSHTAHFFNFLVLLGLV